MKRALALAFAVMLAGCGMGDSARDKPAAPGEGELRALANAKAMVESREDESLADTVAEQEGSEP